MYISRYFSQYEFVLLMDSDVVVEKDAVDRLIAEWHPGVTPCINTKGCISDHVVTSCALVGRSDYGKVDYLTNLYECQCLKLPNPFYVEGLSGYEVKEDV